MKKKKKNEKSDGTTIYKFRNAYGIGQYANHPPKGTAPNVMVYPFEFMKDMPQDLLSFVPNSYQFNKAPGLLKIGTTEVAMHCLLVISTAWINNTECFLNYRYNPENEYPDWYAQPDEDEARRRWGLTGGSTS